ncbi:protein of unknown function [Modestobacter sp. DSM 44400]|uniref:DUF4192 domain-containing protein n=1 Tax=Modestobacter sp. DSM 44400 TaxID=1550230 RepID=UPI000894B08D|nr:DUF4192 domain-containing protein [Modestobacter sp. DSM 44400]SDY14141.1 protein of unknown function [Modestobacter sp. DSM 44400]
MADDLPPTPVRLSQLGELAAAVPLLLGFRPRESLVAVSLRGGSERSGRTDRVGLTARVDLPTAAHRSTVVDQLVGALLTDGPRAVVLVVVSDAPHDVAPALVAGGAQDRPSVVELPHRSLVREALLRFTDAGVGVEDAVLVRRGRWWSYDCAEECCLPDEGTPLPGGTSPLAAASAMAGLVVEQERADLERRIAPVGFLAAAGMAAACDEVGAEVSARVARLGWAALAAESEALLEDAVARVAPGTVASLADRELARLAWALLDEGVRDRAMGFALGQHLPAVEVLWTELTRRVPPPLDAAPATLLAVTAWVQGNGAMANVALDRALSSQPGYRMAQLLRSALDACLPPADVRRLVREGIGARRAVG